MNWFFIVLSILFLFIIMLIFSNIKLHLVLNKEFKNDFIEIHIYVLFGLLHLQKKIPLIVLESLNEGIKFKSETKAVGVSKETKNRVTPKKVINWRKQFKYLLYNVQNLTRIMKVFLKHVYIDQYKWDTEVGTGDAMQTGVITGLIWGFKANIFGLISHYTSTKIRPILTVNPEFNKQVIRSRLECILHFRVGYVILTGIRILLNMIKRGGRKWQENIPSKA